MSIDFTVAIPTCNGENRLPMVLERLRSQTGVEQLAWEIIVVDNNSTDNTAKVVQDYQANWSYPFSLRYTFEAEQGAGFARQRAIQEARGELVGFLDDDNLPAPNWIIKAYKFAQEHPQAGAYGSQIHGAFEVDPPENLKKIIFYLAIVERGSQPHLYNPHKNGFPPSAGLVVRRHAWQQHVPPRLFLFGRVGSSMLACEDYEVLSYIYRAKWEVWYNPVMEVEHVIPSWRLEKSYLISLIRGIALVSHHLRMLKLQSWQRPFAFLIYLANDLRKVILHFVRYKTVFKQDIATAFEIERLIYTLISPLYLLGLKINRLIKTNP